MKNYKYIVVEILENGCRVHFCTIAPDERAAIQNARNAGFLRGKSVFQCYLDY